VHAAHDIVEGRGAPQLAHLRGPVVHRQRLRLEADQQLELAGVFCPQLERRVHVAPEQRHEVRGDEVFLFRVQVLDLEARRVLGQAVRGEARVDRGLDHEL
jgi:hypothetical protein